MSRFSRAASGPRSGEQSLSRRDLLKVTVGGAAGLALAPHAASAAAATTAGSFRRCILIVAEGGPSHLDTFDPKPDAPLEYRGAFGAISTNVSGLRLCEHLPRLACMADRFTVVRGLTHGEEHHERASRLMLGWIVPEMDAPGAGPLPVHVSLGEAPRGTAAGRFAEIAAQGSLVERVRDARRLLENGARLVTVTHKGWDTHGNAFAQLRDELLPQTDLALSMLLTDLSDRGLLEDTLVVWTGEFGRTPRVNDWGGRDHHSACFSALLAGGGYGGTVLGASDALGMEPAEQRFTPVELARLIRSAVA